MEVRETARPDTSDAAHEPRMLSDENEPSSRRPPKMSNRCEPSRVAQWPCRGSAAATCRHGGAHPPTPPPTDRVIARCLLRRKGVASSWRARTHGRVSMGAWRMGAWRVGMTRGHDA